VKLSDELEMVEEIGFRTSVHSSVDSILVTIAVGGGILSDQIFKEIKETVCYSYQ